MAQHEGKQNPGGDSVYIVSAVLALAIGYLLWTRERPLLITPLFAMDWLQYQFLNAVHLLGDDRGSKSLRYTAYYLRHRTDIANLDWSDVVIIQNDIGHRMRWFVTALMMVLAVTLAFKMKGDGFRQNYTLTGQAYDDVTRFLGMEVKGKFLVKLLTGKFKFFLFRWMAKPHSFLLSKTKVVQTRQEWLRRGTSLFHFQAAHWKATLPSAYFNPDLQSPNEMPQRHPMEWLRDNKVGLVKGDVDVEAAENVMFKQLGPMWQGIEKAPYYVQALCVLYVLNYMRKKKDIAKVCERLSEIHVLQSSKAEEETRKLIAPYLNDPKIVSAINTRGGKHAYTNTAVIGIYGAAGPMKMWGGGDAGVMAPSSFRWLKGVDRNLWYCLNNVGRYKFHIEGSGAISHFFAERVLKQPIVDPYTDSALDGLERFVEEQGVDTLDQFFRKKAAFGE